MPSFHPCCVMQTTLVCVLVLAISQKPTSLLVLWRGLNNRCRTRNREVYSNLGLSMSPKEGLWDSMASSTMYPATDHYNPLCHPAILPSCSLRSIEYSKPSHDPNHSPPSFQNARTSSAVSSNTHAARAQTCRRKTAAARDQTGHPSSTDPGRTRSAAPQPARPRRQTCTRRRARGA